MTNKEKYQRTFSVLHASGDCMMEVKPMNRTMKRSLPGFAAACAAIVLMLGLSAVAYAADIGGIQRSIQLWFQGEQTDAVLEIRNGEYTLGFQDAAGNTHEIHGGGVALEPDGQERPLTEDEIMEHLEMPQVAYEDDGSVWVYYQSQKLDITSMFDENGVCYVLLKDGSNSRYMTVKHDGGYATSPHKYPNPDTFD